MRVRVFLRQPLFVLPGDAHVPPAAMILVGNLGEETPGGVLHLRAEVYLDEKGRLLEGEPRRLLVPVAKIDHMLVEGV